MADYVRRNRVIAFLAVIALALVLFLTFCKGKGCDRTPARSEVTNAQPSPAPSVVPAKATKDCDSGETTIHVAQPGESLWKISKKEYHGNPLHYLQLAAANNLDDPDVIHPGQDIVIPCESDLPRVHQRTVLAKKVKDTKPAPVVAAAKTPAPEPKPKAETPAAVPAAQAAPQAQPEKKELAPVAPPPAQALATPQAKVEPPAQAKPQAQPQPQPAPPPPPPAETRIAAISNAAALKAMPAMSFPGNLWNSTGVQSPFENGNVTSITHLEQGWTVWRSGAVQFGPYVSADVSTDMDGKPWNNRVVGQAGLKLTKSFSHGVVGIGGAYIHEQRFRTDGSGPTGGKGQPAGFTFGWFGWQNPVGGPSARRFFGAYPGSTWFVVGNISPFDGRSDVIGAARLEQGVSIWRTKKFSFGPYGELGLGFDSQGSKATPWNDRVLYGGGLKATIPIRASQINLYGGYRCENRWQNGQKACGLNATVDLWSAWKLFSGRKGGR